MPSTATHSRSSSKSRRNATARPRGAKDAIALLRADHQLVQKLFDDFERKSARMKPAGKQALAERICRELKIHTQIEEEILYPAARDAVRAAEDLLDEAEVEHASAKELIAQIERAEPSDELYDAKVTVLGEYVKHHVKEEQNELFPKLKSAGKLDLAELGEQLAARKAEIEGEMAGGGMPIPH